MAAYANLIWTGRDDAPCSCELFTRRRFSQRPYDEVGAEDGGARAVNGLTIRELMVPERTFMLGFAEFNEKRN